MPEESPGPVPEEPDIQPGRQPEGAPGPLLLPAPSAIPAPADPRLLSPVSPKVWETGETPGDTRVPGTRRLWLAGALALSVIVGTLTAIAVLNDRIDDSSDNRKDRAGTAADPSATPEFTLPGAPVDEPSGKSGMSSPQSSGSKTKKDDSGSVETQQRGSKPAGDSEPSKSASKPSATWKSVRSVNYPDRYWHISNGLVRLDPVSSYSSSGTREDATFKLVKGLAKSSCYSFATADGTYLRHRDFVLRPERNDGSGLFKQDATFCPRGSAASGAIMLESVDYPGYFLRHRNFQLELDRYEYSYQYGMDSAFQLVGGLR